MKEMQFHPVSALFPVMPQEEFESLVADIAQNGLREPIHVLGEAIIDGRHRYRACLLARVEPRFVEVDPGADVYALVISLNLRRRHLSESQRAMVAARMETLEHGQRASACRDANLHVCSRGDAAQALSVSGRSVAHAAKVQAQGVDELVHAVDQGAISVSRAAEIARLPADDQRAVLTKTPDEIRAIAREVKARIDKAGVCGKSAVRIFDRVAAEQQLSGIEQCAVVEVIKAEDPPLPTPAEARRIACTGAPGLMVLASDGRYHSAPGNPEDNARMECWMRLREGLELMATLPFPVATALAVIPAYQYKNVSTWLAQAVPFLNELNQLWSQHHV